MSRFLALLLAVFLGPGVVLAQPKLWGNLTAGEFAVGFRAFWTSDPGRTFTYKFADGTRYDETRPARPILVNVWYPAQAGGTPMREGDYLDFDPADGSLLSRYAKDLIAQNRSVIATDVVDKSLEEMDAAGKAGFENYLKAETKAVRGAPPAAGRFPVVVYIQGYGSSLQDNSAACEFLASHGALACALSPTSQVSLIASLPL